MLVCPQCQFDNPDNHKFCQKCGASLTEQACPACDTLVPFSLEQCPHCGASTGVVWRAIVLTAPSQASPGTASASELAAPSIESASVPGLTAQYLDSQQRYKLLDPLPPFPIAVDTEVRVLDCQPFQPSLLEALNPQEAEQPIDLDLKEAINGTNQIPAIAQTYAELQQHLYPSLPQIHDAWEAQGQVIVLLQDRQNLLPLFDAWNEEEVLPLQILHWLYEMTELWSVLAPYHYCQSLLEPNNLRVDEDQLLCLQRLYPDLPNHPLQLSDLGKLWYMFFQASQRTQIGSLIRLCQDLIDGDIVVIDEVRSRLEEIADELQPDSIPAAIPPELTENYPLSSPPMLEDVSDETPTVGYVMPSIPPAADLNLLATPTRLELGDIEEDPTSEGDDVPTVVLPMKLIALEDAGRSDIGKQRNHNEDYFSIQLNIDKVESPSGRTLRAKGLYILCDGMGGHAGGEVASALAVDTLKQYFKEHWHDKLPDEKKIREAIYQANKAIYDLNQQNARSGSGRMGTTLVVVLLQDTEVAIAHVGDSRLYRFSRRRGLEQLTTDHEVGQREIQRGVEPAIAYARPDAYQLTQALGPRDENFVNPDVQFLELNEDLLLLLCSDGLTDNDLLENHWQTHLEPLVSPGTNLEQGVSRLIDLANEHNGHDNITAVVIRARVRPNLEQLRR